MVGHVHHLFVSPGHNYFGHHGKPAGQNPILEVEQISCVAGRGIEGDRFFDYKEDYKGQITFFSADTVEQARKHFNLPTLFPDVFRRNAIVSGLDLRALEFAWFSIDGVLFEGMGEAKPCYWMDQAVATGAEVWLRGSGGLRAKIRRGGVVRRGPVAFALESAPANQGALDLAPIA